MTEEDDLKVEWRWRGGAEKMTAGTARRPCRRWEGGHLKLMRGRWWSMYIICGIDGEN